MRAAHRRQGDTTTEHELYDLTEECTSNEGSITEAETNEDEHGDIRPPFHQCESRPKKYENSSKEYSYTNPRSRRPVNTENLVVDEKNQSEGIVVGQTPASPVHNLRNLHAYLPQAMVAVEQLNRLKHLQHRRDYCERYYSQAIRELISANFFPPNTAAVASNPKSRGKDIAPMPIRGYNDKQYAGGVGERTRGGGFTKEPEPRGTITTITRLDCGCVEEKKIQVLRSIIRRVQKCEDHQGRHQERPTSKPISPNPQELSYRYNGSPEDIDNHIHQCPGRCQRGEIANDGGAYKISTNFDPRDVETWNDRSAPTRNRRSPRTASPVRASSPVAKYSATSSNIQ